MVVLMDVMNGAWWAWIVPPVLLLLWLVYAWGRARRGQASRLPILLPPGAENVHRLTFEPEPAFVRKGGGALAEQSESWRSGMREVGERLTRHHVRAVVFVHGTFTGDDPMGIVRALQVLGSRLGPALERRVRRLVRAGTNAWLGEAGNFTPRYVQLFKDAIAQDILCEELVWSSENHHVGRLRGMLALITTLARLKEQIAMDPPGRLLLIGHSHAGQLFALMSLFRDDEALARAIGEVAFSPEERRRLDAALAALGGLEVDFVTFGAPVRYPWGRQSAERLLQFVNHRGPGTLAGDWTGILTTKGGDYVQQIGVLGSDILALSGRDRQINRRLDDFLEVGLDLRRWQAALREKRRVSPFGLTLLVDYGDGGGRFPNAQRTLFGHGVYTRFDAMLFNFRQIGLELYP